MGTGGVNNVIAEQLEVIQRYAAAQVDVFTRLAMLFCLFKFKILFIEAI